MNCKRNKATSPAHQNGIIVQAIDLFFTTAFLIDLYIKNAKTASQPHQGRNMKCIREMLGIIQEALAVGLGLTQQAVSQLEQKEALDDPLLEKVD